MATLLELCDCGLLTRLGGGLAGDEQPCRLLAAFPHAVKWLDDTLPRLEPLLDEGRQSPLEQVDDLLHDFVSGADMSFYKRSHSMDPHDKGIWELKTPDVRVFGWFVKRGVFVMANVDSAINVKDHHLYTGYRENCVYRRDQLDLDAPKFLVGEYADVL